MVYTVKSECIEDSSVEYEDGKRTIYLYTRGTKGNPGRELQDMLKYLEHSIEENVKNEDIAAVHRLASEVKMDEEVGISFMKSWELEQFWMRRGLTEGREKGIAEGRAEGREEGRMEILVELVRRKLEKNMTVREIAEQLEEQESKIQRIADVSSKYAPDYESDKILEELLQRT